VAGVISTIVALEVGVVASVVLANRENPLRGVPKGTRLAAR